MNTALGPGAKAPAMLDFKMALLESFAMANQLLISNISDAAWEADSPTGKGRNIAYKNAKLAAKISPDGASKEQVLGALKASATAMEKRLQKALEDPSGKVPNFRPDVVAFAGYLIAHDSHHRGPIAMMA